MSLCCTIYTGFSTFRVQQAGYSGVKDGDETCQGVDTVRNGKLEKRLVIHRPV